MCGRYQLYLDADDKELNEILNAVRKNCPEYPLPTGDIYPTNQVPIIEAQRQNTAMEIQTWGFPNFRNKGVIINARSETAAEKSMFRKALQYQRCVVPTSGFYEWTKEGIKHKYLLREKGSKALYLAGIWNIFEDVKRFVILTTEANSSMAAIHDRMPIILHKDDINPWLFDTQATLAYLGSRGPELIATNMDPQEVLPL